MLYPNYKPRSSPRSKELFASSSRSCGAAVAGNSRSRPTIAAEFLGLAEELVRQLRLPGAAVDLGEISVGHPQPHANRTELGIVLPQVLQPYGRRFKHGSRF